MRKFLFLTFLILATACAPKVKDRDFGSPQMSFSSDDKDANLKLRLRERGEAPPVLFWKETVSTATYFEQAENLIAIGEASARPELRQKGLSWIRKFYETPESTLTMDFSYSPFVNLAAAQVEKQVQDSLTEVLEYMEYAKPVVLAHVLALGKKMPTLPQKGFEGLLAHAENFTVRFIADLPNMNLRPVIEEALRIETLKATAPLFADVRIILAELNAAKTLSQTLVVIDHAMVKFNVVLDPVLENSLKQGRNLARGLDRLRDEQDALTVIVDVWNMLTPEEKREYFKPANDELYDFLKDQDNKELNCLRTRGCLGGPIDGVVKKVFILPKVKKFGVQKIHALLNEQAMNYVFTSIELMAQEFVRTLPETFAQNIDDAWSAKVGRMEVVREDLQSYVTRVAGVWSKKVLPETEGRVLGFETSLVAVSAGPEHHLRLTPKGKAYELNGAVAGASLSAGVKILENSSAKSPMGLRTAFSQISKLVALSGYRNSQGKIVPALLAPVNHREKLLDIADFEAAKDVNFSFRVPDSISLKDPFVADPRLSYEKTFSASAMAAQIKGLSQTLRFTADWKKSSFDIFLTPIKAQDLTDDAKDPALQQTLFPKEMLFALNVGTVSVLLQDLMKKMTPVILFTLDHKIMTADQYATNSPETPIMAGIVDIKNGQKSKIIHTQDVAKFIFALAEFIEALEGVENTKSPLLLNKNIRGTRPLEAVISGKKDLRKLMIAMANFLSKKALTSQSLVSEKFSLETKGVLKNEVLTASTQATAVRALLKAYQVSGIEAYLWSAQEVYFSMNKNLYSVKQEFYVNGDGSELSFPEKVNVLRTLSEIKAYVPSESQRQLQNILNPWLDALAALR